MSGKGNADTNRGERKMEGGEDSVRTLDCLRGRLLAERAASRIAKQEAHQLGDKLMELETLLKQEAKSRNRAEKKLKSLMKKLESINIPYVSDESEYSAFMDKSDISSTSSSTPKFQQQNHNTEISNQNQESKESAISQKQSKTSQPNWLSSLSDDTFTAEDISISAFEIELKRQERQTGHNEDASSGRSLSSASDENSDKSRPKIDRQSDYESIMSDPDSQIDDSMALVLVDTTHNKNHTVDPKILDQTVKEVLNALRYAKEQLQSSMERRGMNMIRVG